MDEKLKEIEKIKKIPADVKKKINNKVYVDILIATFIMCICVFLLLRYNDTESDTYILILRILSVVSIFGAICIIELAYKKDSLVIAINAIESIVGAFVFLYFTYSYVYNFYNFPQIIVVILSILGVYYSIKGIITIYIEKKKYRKSINDIKDITKQ